MSIQPLTMADNTAQDSAGGLNSRTFRTLDNNPFRIDAQNAFKLGDEDDSGSIKLLFRKLEKCMVKKVKAYWEKNTL